MLTLIHTDTDLLDLHDQCAVVTLVVSNCLKYLLSHSCPYRPLYCCGKPVPEQVPASEKCEM
jgi:hypothetical protein